MPPDRAPAATAPAGSRDPAAPPGGTSWPLLVAVAAVLTGAVLAGRLATARSRRAGAGEVTTADPGSAADPTALVAAVDAAGAQLAGHDDARAAIVAAYSAMAASIAAGLARRRDAGLAARASDTPTELLDRAVVAGLVGRGPAGELTALFGEARFSRHPMGAAHRRAAQDALARVRDELASRR